MANQQAPYAAAGCCGRRRPISLRACTLTLVVLLAAVTQAQQQPPAIGYMHPSGGQAGSTVDVVLGGYDWTPDMELFVRHPKIQLELAGSPSSVIVPEPPYWFGKKARRPPFLMPSETAAQLRIPAGTPPGIYRWQAANANGATASGRFAVCATRQLREDVRRTAPQELDSLPVTVSGQIRKIEEVDRYRFSAPHDGPITLKLIATAIGSPLTAALEVHDARGQLVGEASDTGSQDLCLTFAAKHARPYVVSLYDVDFRGNRAFVYRLQVAPSPRIVAAIPAAGRPGETRDVEFVGFGVATGGAALETITQEVTFPEDAVDSFVPRLSIGGSTQRVESVPLLVSDLPEVVERRQRDGEPIPLALPSAVTGVLLQRYGVDRYHVAGNKGDVWAIDLAAQTIGSRLDVALTVFDAEGKELKRVDDGPATTDVGLEFRAPADGTYELQVSDISGQSGDRAATYRLAIRAAEPGFQLSGPERLNLPLGGKTQLTINATRTGGFVDPITLHIEGLPEGVTIAEEIVIPAKKKLVKIALTGADDLGTGARLLRISGRARIGPSEVTRQLDPVLLAVTMPPPFSLDAEGRNDVTKWPRGTTFPAPILIQREDGFEGEIVLVMAAKQGRHRQGIRGPELTVAGDNQRVKYPVFLPEWLETTRTSRMVVNGVAQVVDPRGQMRYLSSKLKTRIGFLPTGALLKLACDVPEIEVISGRPVAIPLTINRGPGLDEDALIELVQDQADDGALSAEPFVLKATEARAVLQLNAQMAADFSGERRVTMRATVMQQDRLPVVSETSVLLIW